MTDADKFAQDAMITQAAATIMAGSLACPECGMWSIKDSVDQAREIYHAAIEARIKGETQ
jgi:hypothetical protein